MSAAWTAQNLVGGTHVIIPMFERVAVMKAIETHRADSGVLVPAMIQLVVDHLAPEEHDLSSFKTKPAVRPAPRADPGRGQGAMTLVNDLSLSTGARSRAYLASELTGLALDVLGV